MSTEINKGSLFLLPSHMGEPSPNTLFPPYYADIINSVSYYIVENARTARRGLKACFANLDIQKLTIYELNKHAPEEDIETFTRPLFKGNDVAVLSEAGMPCIADPGNSIVSFCHTHSIKVIPVVGPNSILLALIASGGNGQQFTFHGYIPIKEKRKQAIISMEKKRKQSGYTQIFMETPYRNQSLFTDLLEILSLETKLCIACDISLKTEEIKTKTIAEWKQEKLDLHKRLCVFIIV